MWSRTWWKPAIAGTKGPSWPAPTCDWKSCACFCASYEPKQRQSCAADFRDRVVHHAICQVLAPIVEACLIHDTYACRRDKGTHAAVQRVQALARRLPYVLTCDVRKYFESVDHAVLKALWRRKLKDKALLILLDHIIDHPHSWREPRERSAHRGGCWNNAARNCRSAHRNNGAPGNRNDNLGFRLLSTWRCQRARFMDRARVPCVMSRWIIPRRYWPDKQRFPAAFGRPTGATTAAGLLKNMFLC